MTVRVQVTFEIEDGLISPTDFPAMLNDMFEDTLSWRDRGRITALHEYTPVDVKESA